MGERAACLVVARGKGKGNCKELALIIVLDTTS